MFCLFRRLLCVGALGSVSLALARAFGPSSFAPFGGFGAPSSDPSLPLRTGSAVPAPSVSDPLFPAAPLQPGKSRSAGTAFPPTNTTHIVPRCPSLDHARRRRGSFVRPVESTAGARSITWEQISPTSARLPWRSTPCLVLGPTMGILTRTSCCAGKPYGFHPSIYLGFRASRPPSGVIILKSLDEAQSTKGAVGEVGDGCEDSMSTNLNCDPQQFCPFHQGFSLAAKCQWTKFLRQHVYRRLIRIPLFQMYAAPQKIERSRKQ
ncbi:hypothetical protein C8R46DRAFT_1026821 [Mycena filopes]|nr:hypothetical protein C8R46DRAFT_1026821 [Mycena filopes]